MGILEGRTVEILNSFEVPILDSFDVDYLNTKLDQYKQVFPKYEFLGWYSVGNGVASFERKIHSQVIFLISLLNHR